MTDLFTNVCCYDMEWSIEGIDIAVIFGDQTTFKQVLPLQRTVYGKAYVCLPMSSGWFWISSMFDVNKKNDIDTW